MARILFLVSSARSIVLANGSSHDAGVFAADALKPYDRFAAAGAEIAVATVDGKPPQLDPYGLELVFHYPDEDVDFLASVTRTFMRDAEDIRTTLQHLTELDLIAARRIFEALKRANTEQEEARILIKQIARKAWSESANFVTLRCGKRPRPARLSKRSDRSVLVGRSVVVLKKLRPLCANHREAAEAAAVRTFNLSPEQRSRLVAQERG